MDIEKKVVMLLNQFPEVVEKVSQTYNPMTLTRYALDLSQAFNEFYHACQILKEEDEVMKARLLIADSARQVLKNVLTLLGIEAPEQM
jgi:arginyl-tRNA synthetase